MFLSEPIVGIIATFAPCRIPAMSFRRRHTSFGTVFLATIRHVVIATANREQNCFGAQTSRMRQDLNKRSHTLHSAVSRWTAFEWKNFVVAWRQSWKKVDGRSSFKIVKYSFSCILCSLLLTHSFALSFLPCALDFFMLILSDKLKKLRFFVRATRSWSSLMCCADRFENCCGLYRLNDRFAFQVSLLRRDCRVWKGLQQREAIFPGALKGSPKCEYIGNPKRKEEKKYVAGDLVIASLLDRSQNCQPPSCIMQCFNGARRILLVTEVVGYCSLNMNILKFNALMNRLVTGHPTIILVYFNWFSDEVYLISCWYYLLTRTTL